MTQQRLFALDGRPIARASDPVSSHLAAAEITANGTRAAQAAEVLRLLRLHPGTTSRELSRLTYVDRYVAARRLPELTATGQVRRGDLRPCCVSGRLAVTWWPT